MTARLFTAGRIPPRRPGTDTPIASAERLARFARDVLGCDTDAIRRELVQWRDREQLTLGDDLLTHVAAYVAQEPRKAA